MQQENFDEESISEHVAIIKLPSLDNSRWHNHTFHDSEDASISTTPRTMKENHPPTNNTTNLLIYQKDEKAEEHLNDLRKRHKHLAANLNRQKGLKQKKLNEIQRDVEDKRLADCTFKPKTNARLESTRSLQEFLESQYRFAQKVLLKKQKLKQQLDEGKKDETFRPKLLNNLGGRKNKQPIHERLYNLRLKEQEEPHKPKHEFIPTITSKSKNLVREGRVQINLYNDALRRQQKKKELSEVQTQKIERPTFNLTNEKYVAQKFIKEYYAALEQMGIQDATGSLEYIIFNELLYRLGFVVSSKEVDNKANSCERGLVYEAYRLLEKCSINIRNVCVFLMALLGIYHINPTNFQSDNDEATEFNLTEHEGRRLQKHFEMLYRNRLSAEELKKIPNIEQYSFKPVTNPGSTHLAENFRNKMLQQTTMFIENHDLAVEIPSDGLISHADLLILNRLGKQKQIEKRKGIIEQEELKQCTFKPVIIDNNKNRSMMCSNCEDDQLGQKKYEQLYNLAKVKRKTDKQVISKAEIQANEEKKQCTFAPKINKKKVFQKNPEPVTKDVEKSLIRMLEGRKQREVKNQLLNRGQVCRSSTHSHNSSSYLQSSQIELHDNVHKHNKQDSAKHKQTEEQELPFLVIDVNLGDQTEQIIVYKDEVDQPEMLAQEFSARHGLDSTSKQRLLDLLKIEINNILQKIEEEEENGSEQ